jgi:cytochrome c biogenesis protein ResB
MSDAVQPPPSGEVPRETGRSVSSELSLLGSLKVGLTVVILIAVACISGTLIPQGPEQVAHYVQRHPGAQRTMDILTTVGLTRVFDTWWFTVLLFVLAASLMVCTGRRFTAMRRSTGAIRARAAGSFITHVSLLLVLAGGMVRVIWGQKGMVSFHEGQTIGEVSSLDGAFPLPLSLRLVDFTLERYESSQEPLVHVDKLVVLWPARNLQLELPVELDVAHPISAPDAAPGSDPLFTIRVVRYVPDFVIGNSGGEIVSRSDEPNNPAVLVSVSSGGATNTEWVFTRFPDFGRHDGADAAAPLPLKFRFVSAHAAVDMGRAAAPIKAFRSTVEVLENGSVARRAEITVNSPLSYRGFTFYQSGYNDADLTWTSLQVVRDPGVPIVYAGFVLMMIGLTVVFCVGPWLGTQRRQ